MAAESAISTIAHVIQPALAPVFLLSGVGALLAVLSNRLSRIVDRARVLEGAVETADAAHAAAMRVELSYLARRAPLIHWAISLCTTCALLICVVIATLFISSHLAWDNVHRDLAAVRTCHARPDRRFAELPGREIHYVHNIPLSEFPKKVLSGLVNKTQHRTASLLPPISGIVSHPSPL